MFISKPHTRARQANAISDHFPSRHTMAATNKCLAQSNKSGTAGATTKRQCHLCCAATRQKSFPSYWSVCFPLHQPAMRQTLHLLEGIYLQERRPMGSFFICMDATGW